jgi:hypothetical protein
MKTPPTPAAKPDKIAIKAALDLKQEVPGAMLNNGSASLSIRVR